MEKITLGKYFIALEITQKYPPYKMEPFDFIINYSTFLVLCYLYISNTTISRIYI